MIDVYQGLGLSGGDVLVKLIALAPRQKVGNIKSPLCNRTIVVDELVKCQLPMSGVGRWPYC